ncbi:hypothetical protein CAPTEDRAFT_221727 [Capitella teleta]|uniref:Homeobox domain-containing protein n=1 Tax=Capitella teleta TaxID=283909 RepID=R7TFU7_CAPTE|nr:hypothetical protein CAPTEDRAFT_221727 [Capitella teleta]|eukprot:ELT92609.1 hypothetical protein CAPTEDRAFT_221727 [Capitella teleta]
MEHSGDSQVDFNNNEIASFCANLPTFPVLRERLNSPSVRDLLCQPLRIDTSESMNSEMQDGGDIPLDLTVRNRLAPFGSLVQIAPPLPADFYKFSVHNPVSSSAPASGFLKWGAPCHYDNPRFLSISPSHHAWTSTLNSSNPHKDHEPVPSASEYPTCETPSPLQYDQFKVNPDCSHSVIDYGRPQTPNVSALPVVDTLAIPQDHEPVPSASEYPTCETPSHLQYDQFKVNPDCSHSVIDYGRPQTPNVSAAHQVEAPTNPQEYVVQSLPFNNQPCFPEPSSVPMMTSPSINADRPSSSPIQGPMKCHAISLADAFAFQPYPTREMKEALAIRFNTTYAYIQTWFIRERLRCRKLYSRDPSMCTLRSTHMAEILTRSRPTRKRKSSEVN